MRNLTEKQKELTMAKELLLVPWKDHREFHGHPSKKIKKWSIFQTFLIIYQWVVAKRSNQKEKDKTKEKIDCGERYYLVTEQWIKVSHMCSEYV